MSRYRSQVQLAELDDRSVIERASWQFRVPGKICLRDLASVSLQLVEYWVYERFWKFDHFIIPGTHVNLSLIQFVDDGDVLAEDHLAGRDRDLRAGSHAAATHA